MSAFSEYILRSRHIVTLLLYTVQCTVYSVLHIVVHHNTDENKPSVGNFFNKSETSFKIQFFISNSFTQKEDLEFDLLFES